MITVILVNANVVLSCDYDYSHDCSDADCCVRDGDYYC